MNNDRIYYSHDAEVQALRLRSILTVLCLIFGVGIGAALALCRYRGGFGAPLCPCYWKSK
jgi:hypothetical protein